MSPGRVELKRNIGTYVITSWSEVYLIWGRIHLVGLDVRITLGLEVVSFDLGVMRCCNMSLISVMSRNMKYKEAYH